MPRIARLVVCGLSEGMATFSPTRALVSVDFPTLGRPTKVTKPERPWGSAESDSDSPDGVESTSDTALPLLRLRRLHVARRGPQDGDRLRPGPRHMDLSGAGPGAERLLGGLERL